MTDLFRLWWHGAKFLLCFLAVSILWSGLAWTYQILAGWLPVILFQSIGWALSLIFYPISLSIAVNEVFKRQNERV